MLCSSHKKEFPAKELILMQVYADNAATTRMHQTAIDTMTYHLNNTFGNP